MDIQWLTNLFWGGSTAQALVSLSLAVGIGMMLGSVRFRGVGLGVGGVLFSSLLLGHLGIAPQNHVLLEFVREFGLILFVFTVGLQVGPSFLDLIRKRGTRLNVMAFIIVFLGCVTTVVCAWVFGLAPDVAVGLFSGAVTNTPSLAAASQMFMELKGAEEGARAAQTLGLGYAVAYPFGILGIILTMLLVRFLGRVNVQEEMRALEAQFAPQEVPIKSTTFRVTNAALAGTSLEKLRTLLPPNCLISSVGDDTEMVAPKEEHVLQQDALIHLEHEEKDFEKLRILLGVVAHGNVCLLEETRSGTPVLVTSDAAVGKSLATLGLVPEKGVMVTSIVRGGMEFTPGPDTPLHYGDTLMLIGNANSLEWASTTLGNSPKRLIHPQVMPLFIGIILGVILGSIPVAVPGLPAPLKLGLAGGPLLMAIFLSRVSTFCGMNWYMSPGANFMLRDVGIALFLACVGLNSGSGFFAALADGSGFYLMGIAALITLIPLLIASFISRVVLHCNYASMCGLLSGSMTDPPALAFATQSLKSDAPASVYATVYPFTMLLRILAGQLLVLILCS